jgi:UDP-GlcNAc:undecaprenyl-phosphate GlcNAc-1-phosphate transferase
MTLNSEASQALPALIIGFLLAAAITLVATPIVGRLARRYGMVDHPEARRVNEQAIARGGGIAILPGFVLVSVVLLFANSVVGLHFVDEPQVVTHTNVLALLGGAVLAVGIGFLDDWYQLRARWQLLGQIGLAAVALVLGIAVRNVNSPVGGTLNIGDLAAVGSVATVLWIVGMVNSLNFIDGLDGLSSGIALIAAMTLGVISLTASPIQPYVAMFCFILAGALAGFLRWNFNPASIFPGTSGIMLVGYTLAVLSILGTAKIAVALLVLGVPIMDTFWIIVRRLASRRSPFAADRSHIHHRLLDLGLSQRATVLLIYGVCILLAVLSLRLSGTGATYAFLGLLVLFGLALLLIERLGGGAGAISESLSASSYDPAGERATANEATVATPAASTKPSNSPEGASATDDAASTETTDSPGQDSLAAPSETPRPTRATFLPAVPPETPLAASADRTDRI